MTLAPSFISLIDSTNKPLLVHVIPSGNGQTDEVLKFNILSNMALDYFESNLFEWMSINQSTPDIKELFQMEGVSIYGKFVKQTCLKIVLGFPTQHKDVENAVIDVFRTVSKIYVECKCNPFVTTEKELVTQLAKRFNEKFK